MLHCSRGVFKIKLQIFNVGNKTWKINTQVAVIRIALKLQNSGKILFRTAKEKKKKTRILYLS